MASEIFFSWRFGLPDGVFCRSAVFAGRATGRCVVRLLAAVHHAAPRCDLRAGVIPTLRLRPALSHQSRVAIISSTKRKTSSQPPSDHKNSDGRLFFSADVSAEEEVPGRDPETPPAQESNGAWIGRAGGGALPCCTPGAPCARSEGAAPYLRSPLFSPSVTPSAPLFPSERSGSELNGAERSGGSAAIV